MVPAPPVRRRLVGKALRRYRENLGYSLHDVAAILECDPSKVSRIETGQRGIRPKELRELLGEYGIAGEQLDILTLLADPRGAFGWFRDYDNVLHGAEKDYLTLETAAAKVWAYEARRSRRCCRPAPTRGRWPRPTRPWTTTPRATGPPRRSSPASARSWRSSGRTSAWSSGRRRCTSRSAARQ
jgi:transcriptional regulator with XRE-family HTH domain